MGVAFLTHHHTFAAVGAPLPPLPVRCGLWSVSGAALDEHAEHARSDLVRSWISVISLPVACFASAMYSVLFFRGPVLVPSCDQDEDLIVIGHSDTASLTVSSGAELLPRPSA